MSEQEGFELHLACDTIEVGEQRTIPVKKQLLVSGRMNVHGTLTVAGRLSIK
jgi:hypothetical protein